jgi:hypothetical protein
LKYDKDLPFITKKVNSLGMVAGGSGKKISIRINKNIKIEAHNILLTFLGIAPLFQIAKTICLDVNDNTQIKMIYSNHVSIRFI